MDASDWIALSSVVIAIVAAVFAGLAWHQARRSANAAERTAAAEERAAIAAERAEEARQAPRVEFRAKGTSGTIAQAVVALVGGPPEVDIRATGVWIKDTPALGERTTLGPDGDNSRISINGQHPVPIDLRSRQTELTIEVEVECIEVSASPRTWTRTGTLRFPAAPHEPATAPSQPAADSPPRGLFH